MKTRSALSLLILLAGLASCHKEPAHVYASPDIFFSLARDLTYDIVVGTATFRDPDKVAIKAGDVYCNDQQFALHIPSGSILTFSSGSGIDEINYRGDLPLSTLGSERTWRFTGDTVNNVIVPPFNFIDANAFPDTLAIPHTCTMANGLTLQFSDADSVIAYGMVGYTTGPGTRYQDRSAPRKSNGNGISFSAADMSWINPGDSFEVQLYAYKTTEMMVGKLHITTTRQSAFTTTIWFK